MVGLVLLGMLLVMMISALISCYKKRRARRQARQAQLEPGMVAVLVQGQEGPAWIVFRRSQSRHLHPETEPYRIAMQELPQVVPGKPAVKAKPSFLVMQPDGDASIATALEGADAGSLNKEAGSSSGCKGESAGFQAAEPGASPTTGQRSNDAETPQYDADAQSRV
mmetsp:Transcript_7383/g.21813  ORF Transcript_7383/g.21813 Transcript_7383/m.21813 type:complete len:166 (-) Transcript_7383:1397-1894(-)